MVGCRRGLCHIRAYVGVPYYNIPFFYVFQRAYGWSRAEITLGFPLAALLTIWLGPLSIHRFSPRKLIIAGPLTAIAGGIRSNGIGFRVYYALWVVFTADTCFPDRSAPAHRFPLVPEKPRQGDGGRVFGNGLMGSVGSLLVKPQDLYKTGTRTGRRLVQDRYKMVQDWYKYWYKTGISTGTSTGTRLVQLIDQLIN